MFVDQAEINVVAGKGGDGCVHFRKEKYIPKGGPDGGNGGPGGNVIFRVKRAVHTLYDFRHQKLFKAANGRPGDKKNMTGKSGENLIIDVPEGTVIRDKNTKEILADLIEEGSEFLIAKGGKGGKGNAGFVNSVRQAPSFAEKGDEGEAYALELELKLVADVALVGYPSVGKSTFIASVSNAKPKIAEYHFTTLVPNLGVAETDEGSLVFVDVPGLIEGASEGKGLGIQFLKHIERAKYVLHLIDINSDTPLKDFSIIRSELQKFSQNLSEKPFIPVFTKIDSIDQEFIDFLSTEFNKEYGIKPRAISSVSHKNIQELLYFLYQEVDAIEKKEEELVESTIKETSEKTEEFVTFTPDQKADPRQVEVEKTENWYTLKNGRLEQMVRQTDTTNPEAMERIYDVLKKWGMIRKLERIGVNPGDQLMIGEHFWEFRG